MDTRNPLEIHIHLEDGRIVRFIQQDEELARQQLAHLQPTKLFAQPLMMFGSADSLTMFQLSQVARVEFIAEKTPDYPFYHAVLDIQQITPDEFRARYHPQTFATLREKALATPDIPITVFSEMELVNGERLFFQVCVKVTERLPLEQGIFVSQLFNAHGIHARLPGGGIVIVNPANIARFTIYPSPSTLPPGTWQASRVIQ